MVNLLLSIKGILHLLSCHFLFVIHLLSPWPFSIVLLSKLDLHQSDLVVHSRSEDILLVEKDVKKLALV